jgi:hypothetical protein
MEKYNWKAGFSTAQKITTGKYYQIGLAESKYDFKNYILFQKPYELIKDESPEAEQNGIYAEANGDTCFNKVEYVKITSTAFEALIFGSLFKIDVSEAKITKKFKEYAHEIFGEKLTIIE